MGGGLGPRPRWTWLAVIGPCLVGLPRKCPTWAGRRGGAKWTRHGGHVSGWLVVARARNSPVLHATVRLGESIDNERRGRGSWCMPRMGLGAKGSPAARAKASTRFSWRRRGPSGGTLATTRRAPGRTHEGDAIGGEDVAGSPREAALGGRQGKARNSGGRRQERMGGRWGWKKEGDGNAMLLFIELGVERGRSCVARQRAASSDMGKRVGAGHGAR